MKVLRTVVLMWMATGTIASAQHPLRAGRWEVTMQMQMANMPMPMPDMKTVQCVTSDQLKDPLSTVPQAPQGRGGTNQDCKLSDYKVSGNTVTWTLACTKPQPITSTGEMVFDGDTYSGTMKMNAPQGDISMKLAGRRLGDCTQ